MRTNGSRRRSHAKTGEGAEGDEDEEVLPHIPASFDFEDFGGGAARGVEMRVRTKPPYVSYSPHQGVRFYRHLTLLSQYRVTRSTTAVFFPLGFDCVAQMVRCCSLYMSSARILPCRKAT
jgi:hypothetical protein